MSREKDEQIAPESFDLVCKLQQKLMCENHDSFFGNKTASESKSMSKIVTYLESNFDFTSSYYLYVLKQLHQRDLNSGKIQCILNV